MCSQDPQPSTVVSDCNWSCLLSVSGLFVYIVCVCVCLYVRVSDIVCTVGVCVFHMWQCVTEVCIGLFIPLVCRQCLPSVTDQLNSHQNCGKVQV